MSRTEDRIDLIRERQRAACDYPGRLDEPAVERHLTAFLQGLGVQRQVVRLRAGWRLADHPPLARNIERIMDEWVRQDRDALAVRVAFDDGDAAAGDETATGHGEEGGHAGPSVRAAGAAALSRAAFSGDVLAAHTVAAVFVARDDVNTVTARDVAAAIAAARVRFRWGPRRGHLRTSAAAAVYAAVRGLDGSGATRFAFATRWRFAAWCVFTGAWDLSRDALETLLIVPEASTAVAWAERLFDAFVCGCWLIYWTDDALYWCAKPVVRRLQPPADPRNPHAESYTAHILHGDHHAAIESDVEDLYFWRGVMAPAFAVVRPEWITMADIDDETNAEVRRVMIERYRHGEEIHGAAAFLRDAGAERVDHDRRYGTLWRRHMPGDEPIAMVEVVNATQEPDGSFKRYWLRVPPHMTTARAAVAWTFDVPEQQYAPVKET